MLDLKRLGPDDVAAMRAMNELFGHAFEDSETYRSDIPETAYLKRILGRETVIVLAAYLNEGLVGGLVAYVLDKLEAARSEIYIYDLAVRATHRRQGVATALIEDLKRRAPEHGGWVLFVQADRVDEPAVQLYEKLGVREEPYHYDIPLTPSQG